MEPPTYKLVISDDEGRTTVVPLLRDEVTIGREEGNTIRLTERNVSRSHARLLRRNGSYVIEDLGSYNGVVVNGERIASRAKLSSGDQLAIGDYDLAFQADVAFSAKPVSLPASSQPPPRLVVVGEPAAGAEFTLNKPVLRIGRDERLDIWINHKSISHQHAQVQVGEGKVVIFDLDSANGMRVNGIRTSRAVLETGDMVQLGQVRLRFLPAQGARSLIPVAEEAPDRSQSSVRARKSIIALGVMAMLVAGGAGAVLVTLGSSSELTSLEQRTVDPGDEPDGAQEPTAPSVISTARGDEDLETPPVAQPQEWERELLRARRALASGRFDRAYDIANSLPPDSVLRDTPEFGEIRYRYVQSHIEEGERAFVEGDFERAADEATLVLGVSAITPKQRQKARRLLRRAQNPKNRRIVD